MSVEFEKDCTCEQRHGLEGRARCKIVNRYDKEQLAVRIFILWIRQIYDIKKILITIINQSMLLQHTNLSATYFIRKKTLIFIYLYIIIETRF